ncbi:anthrax toxin-like adenylyl cyclase domain-containing protein [Serratia quinivorans]|uniref:anthrax toxin-like adenylyl cyclase domain-containing protein n=1 Tax=Serratia quinivorans TaxID=137545 RepID=UPI002E7854FC|nr:anthrax toxin-like adenylyl cyclase domain-containing protein [Serratia quinivorans]
MSVLPKIVWPIPSNNRGSEFGNQEEILSHLGGESTGLYMIGRNGMWHGGIHITNATTPWCALSGKAVSEVIDFPVASKGEQAVRCMADGEVVAYRICNDYMQLKWESGPLSISGSFVLVKHYIQPGENATSGLHFYTLYMHLAPYSAYNVNPSEKKWTVQATLSAYDPEWVMTASTNNKGTSESYRKGTMPKGAIVEWDKTDSSLHTVAFNKREYGLVTFVGFTEEAMKKGKKTSLKPGQQYWMLVDKNSVSPGTDGVAQPSWWKKLMPPAQETMKFDQVVCPSPWPISAGDSVGHMGYYQAPKDGGYEARYQVHIECMSMDDNLEKFLTNPEKVGERNPLYLKYSPGLALFKKDVATSTFTKDKKVTTRTGILTLSKVPTEADKSTKQEYWQLRPENAYAPKGQEEPQLLSQYDLAKLGFRTEIAEPTSFDYLDGKKQPTGLFRSLIESLHGAAKDDTRTSHALVKHNYQRLLEKIDSGAADCSSMEYWEAFHNPDYRDVIQKTIVKHPSDWYFKKDDAIWQPFLNALKKEAPEWKKYSEEFLDKMAWMQDVTTELLRPSLWHMHPIKFLGTLSGKDEFKYCELLFGDEIMKTASKYNVIIGIRRPNPLGVTLLKEGYPTKNFHVKAKSSPTGPTAGFISADPFLSKQNHLKQAKYLDEAYKKGAKKVNLKLSQARVKELIECGAMFMNHDGRVYADYPSGRHFFKINTEGEVFYAGNNEAVQVITNAPQIKRHDYIDLNKPITADYDLFCIIPRVNQSINKRPVIVRPKLKPEKLKCKNLSFLKMDLSKEDPDMGNASFFISTIISDINKNVKNIYSGGNLVWHSDEVGNPFSPGFDPDDKPIFIIPRRNIIIYIETRSELSEIYKKFEMEGYTPEYSPLI